MKQRRDPPTREQCLALMSEYGVLQNIQAHCLKVCEVSLAIANALREAGLKTDRPLVEAGALLHDITKTESLETHENHAVTGKKLLEKLGFPLTAQIVGSHIMPEDKRGVLTPSRIVAYADKRVLHERIVDLDERFDYLLETYSQFQKADTYQKKVRQCMDVIEMEVEQATNRTIEQILKP